MSSSTKLLPCFHAPEVITNKHADLLNRPRVGRRDGVDGGHGVVVGVDHDGVRALLGQLRLEVAQLRLQPHHLVTLPVIHRCTGCLYCSWTGFGLT